MDAIRAAAVPHHFLSVTKQGVAAIVRTTGNDCTHIILRGGNDGPNYSASHVEAARKDLAKAGLDESIMIDCSHANSLKNHKNQPKVCADVASQVSNGDKSIIGVMIESHLKEGAQKIPKEGKAGLEYGVSITDACVHWQDTVDMLEVLHQSVLARRKQ